MPTQAPPLDPCIRQYLETHCDDGEECQWCDHLTFLIEDPVNNRPITSIPEQLFLAAWVHTAYDAMRFDLDPQTQIEPYLIDFTTSGLAHFVNEGHFDMAQLTVISSLLPRYAIEIDGFAWHDRTPEQAEYERKRARFVQSQGYTVLRFAAREVLRDPDTCVHEVSYKRVLPDIQAIYKRISIRPS